MMATFKFLVAALVAVVREALARAALAPTNVLLAIESHLTHLLAAHQRAFVHLLLRCRLLKSHVLIARYANLVTATVALQRYLLRALPAWPVVALLAATVHEAGQDAIATFAAYGHQVCAQSAGPYFRSLLAASAKLRVRGLQFAGEAFAGVAASLTAVQATFQQLVARRFT
jgi:hypothetical protein